MLHAAWYFVITLSCAGCHNLAVSDRTEELQLRQVAAPQNHLNVDTTQRQTQAAQTQVDVTDHEPQHAQQAKAIHEYAQTELFGQKAETAQLAQHAEHSNAGSS